MPEHSTQSLPAYADDISGQTFGRITVLRFSHQASTYRRFWHCRCSCATERVLREDYIKSGVVTCKVCRRREIEERKGPRRCASCERTLPRTSFYRDKTTTDGLARYCSNCTRSAASTRRSRLKRRRPEDIAIPDRKRCSTCDVEKNADEFWTDRTQPDGLCNRCAECRNADARLWYERTGRQQRRPKSRTARYGMTPEDLAAMDDAQGSACRICQVAFSGPRSFCIDHDHSTGAVRGLLCNACNTALGLFRDDIDVLQAAIAYLERPS